MKYLKLFEAKKVSKKEVADDIYESVILIFSYFLDDYKELVDIKRNLNYINIYVSNPCTSEKYATYSKQVHKWSEMLNSVDDIVAQLNATLGEEIESDVIYNNSNSIKIMLKIVSNETDKKTIPIFKVNKANIAFNGDKLKEEFVKLGYSGELLGSKIYPNRISWYEGYPAIRFEINGIQANEIEEFTNNVKDKFKEMGFSTIMDNGSNRFIKIGFNSYDTNKGKRELKGMGVILK